MFDHCISGFRGHIARKHYKKLKSMSQMYKYEINQFCAHIEDINNRLIQTLTQLNDKLPGLL